jgi:threonyl-tRNA synthetase
MKINVTLPDGSVRSYDPAPRPWTWPRASAKALPATCFSAKVNGEVRDANRPLAGRLHPALLTWNDTEGKATLWHSSPPT